jgi:hypothetical protein
MDGTMGELGLPKYEGAGKVLYSAVFGKYDEVNVAPTCDSIDAFILFTDDDQLVVEGWEVIYILDTNYSSKFLNRLYKLRPHVYIPNASTTLYIDGNVGFEANAFEPLLSYFNENFIDIMTMTHFSRHCIYDEAEVLLRSSRVKPFVLLKEIASYYRGGFRKQCPMGENNLVLRTKNASQKIGDIWWQKYSLGSGRDQLSLPVVIWQTSVVHALYPFNVREIGSLKYLSHNVNFDRNVLNLIARYIFLVVPFKIIRKVLSF